MDNIYRMLLLLLCFIFSLVALGRTETDWCIKTIECLDWDVTAASARNDRDQICRSHPEVVRCMEDRNSRCDIPEMAKNNQRQIDMFKKNMAAKCTETPRSTSKVPFKQCEKEFIACYKPPSEDPASNASREYICSQHPIVLNCLRQSLSRCDVQGPNEQKTVDNMAMQLKRLEESFRTERTLCKTDCEKDPAAADCNHSSSLVTSLIHTVFVIGIAVLLH